MKEKNWKYLSILLLIVSILFLAYSIYTPNSTGISLEKSTILEKGTLTVLTPGTIPLDVPSGAGLELIQDKFTAGLIITYNHRAWGQTIVFDSQKHVNGIWIAVARVGMPSEPIGFGISRNDKPFFERSNWIYADELPQENTGYWIECYFTNKPWVVNAGEKLVIEVASASEWDENNHWLWLISTQNPYPSGRIIQASSDWTHWDYPSDYANWDGTFAVFTEEAAPQPPVISVTLSPGTAGILGSLTLLGAILAGLRYGILIGIL